MSQSEQEMASFFASRGFGLRMGFGERPAVAVIDFMNGFTDASMPLGANLDKEIEATRQVLAAARQAQTPIYYTACIYDEPDFADAGVWRLKQSGIRSLGAGTPAVELDARLERREDEAIIVKKYASAFFGTDFITRLNARRVDTLLITGCTTSGCVRATAVDALQLGLRPIVVREAVGDRVPGVVEWNLFDIDAKFGDVEPLERVIAYLEELEPAESAESVAAASGQ
jgi:nicotinamidase-related amidase